MLLLTINNKDYNVAESLKEAISMGVSRYIPSGTCTNGHRSVFMVRDDGRSLRGVCIECNRERQRGHNKKYYKNNTEECKLKARIDYHQKQIDKALDELTERQLSNEDN